MTAEGTASVVGSGPNGLAAALRLALAGLDVDVYEAADVPGGGTRTEALTLPGFLHDVCSAVHPMAVASPFFRRLPLADHGLEWIHPPVEMAHPFDDGTAALLLRSTEETGTTLGGGDGRAWRRLMDPFVARWRDVLDDALAPPIHVPGHPLLVARLGWYGLRSARGLVERVFEGARARAFFLGIAAHSLMPMGMRPSAAFGLVLAVCAHGAGWPLPRGGSRRIAEALLGILGDHGGKLHAGRRIVALDDLPPTDVTLLDLTPRQVLEVAGPRLPPGYRRKLEAYRYAPGVFKLDWALSEPIPWAAGACRRAGTVHLGAGAEEIARSSRAAWEGRVTDTPFVLLTQPTLFDPGRAPQGRHVAWAYCHVPHASTRDMTASVEAQVERFAPGFRDTILARHAMDPVALERHDANLVGGDINGGVQDLRQLLFRPVPRLDPYATPCPGLFLCSSSTPPGGGVHGMCGYHAAGSALKRLA